MAEFFVKYGAAALASLSKTGDGYVNDMDKRSPGNSAAQGSGDNGGSLSVMQP
ncbi:MAG: hypothetical protein LBL48_09870 [Azoarcus sp.]|nr:hypothetical protein [Azoarcus sp.]